MPGRASAQDANADAFTAYQSAFWDTANNPDVITSSFGFHAAGGAGLAVLCSPSQQLFIDAALRNITVLFSDTATAVRATGTATASPMS